jgi:Rps23 Pro-64 3,4-dihydroxylase Tpa1-like proline 4-hydroxylase
MKIYKNVLPNDLYLECMEELEFKSEKNCWQSSSFTWNEKIRECVFGECLISPVSKSLSEKIEFEFKKYFSEYNKFEVNFYCWMNGSGISFHTDSSHNRKCGATIYLNESWSPEWGGVFLWYENEKDQLVGKISGLSPQFNNLIINDTVQPHMVTSISPLSPQIRISLQIWTYEI